ncbi:MAG: tetratricopeptide repeat protein [Gemmatimonadaceae bacterium]|nr:tetratricopeptide repeat protein [Gemmatimonadaceae bacterium]
MLTACSAGARRPGPDAFVIAPGTDPATRDADIAFFEKRLTEDPASAADRARLGGLYLARSRGNGAFADAERAESLAMQSLATREAHNGGTWALLASARLSGHDFTGALDAARRYLASDPESPQARAMLGEVLLETGGYDEARPLFDSLEAHTRQPTIAARLARWYEITGRLSHAQAVARYAAKVARLDGGLSREQVAWFQMRVGDLALKRGAFAEADAAYAFGLRIAPDDHRLLAAQARLAAARRDWRTVIDRGERAVALQLDPATLGLLADAWRALGDTSQAESYARAMTVSALSQPGAIHRAWGLYLLDHGGPVADVLARVRDEQRSRRDVYGYDLLAWALHASGDDRAAWRAAQRAIALGTEDAPLLAHAAVIARAVGADAEADRLEARAREVNPSWTRGR